MRRLISTIRFHVARDQPAMPKRLWPGGWGGVFVMVCLIAGLTWMNHQRPAPMGRAPGGLVPEFAIPDARTGVIHRLSDHYGRVVAIVFTGTSCPLGELYFPRLDALARTYENRGVDFLAINSNASESAEDVALHARRSSIWIPVLKDAGNLVADQALAERTCEALVIDRRGILRYRGAIDDQYGLGTRRDLPQHQYLADALESVLAGRKVVPETTPVVGCPIERAVVAKPGRRGAPAAAPREPRSKRMASSAPPPATPTLTYAADVAPILNSRCVGCHRPGQVAPFSLLSYDQARRWSTSIAEVVADRRMPPWHADPRYGKFANDRGLTDPERARLLSWVEQGSPPGDLSAAPESPRFPVGWSIGTPDVVFEFPETIKVPAEGAMPILHFRVPTNLQEDLWIQAAEVRPTDRAVAHHIFVYSEVHANRHNRNKEKVFLAAYLPGDVPPVYPPGVAKKIPAGSTLVYEIHYTPIGSVRFDRPSIGLILAKEPPGHLAITRGLAARGLRDPSR